MTSFSKSDAGYQSQVTPYGVRIDLPRRDLGALRWAGLPILAFGMFFSGFAVFWMIGASGLWPGGGNRFSGGMDWFRLVFAAFGLPFFFAGFAPMFFGLAVIAGRSRVEVTRDKIRNVEVIGPLHWSWSRPRAQLRKLTVTAALGKPYKGKTPPNITPGSSAIAAEFDGAKMLPLAPGYQRETLLEIAKLLAQHCRDVKLDEAPSAFRSDGEDQTPEVAVVDDEVVEQLDFVAQPLNSMAVVDDRRDGVTITLPPTGFIKGSRALLFFAIAWLTILGVIASIILGKSGILSGRMAMDDLGAVAFMGLFVLIGVSILLSSIHLARRRGIIDLIDKPPTALLIARSGIFGSKLQDWPAGDVAAVRVGRSGTEVNDKPLMQLQIVLTSGKQLGFFTGRDEDELQWLASLLRRELGVRKGE